MDSIRNNDGSRHRRKRHTDGASEYKRRNLSAIERRKKMARITYLLLCIMAAVLFLAVVVLYFFDK